MPFRKTNFCHVLNWKELEWKNRSISPTSCKQQWKVFHLCGVDLRARGDICGVSNCTFALLARDDLFTSTAMALGGLLEIEKLICSTRVWLAVKRSADVKVPSRTRQRLSRFHWRIIKLQYKPHASTNALEACDVHTPTMLWRLRKVVNRYYSEHLQTQSKLRYLRFSYIDLQPNCNQKQTISAIE